MATTLGSPEVFRHPLNQWSRSNRELGGYWSPCGYVFITQGHVFRTSIAARNRF